MRNMKMIAPTPISPPHRTFADLWPKSFSRPGLVLIGSMVIVAGLGLNWSWLVAAGLAPLLLSVLPCVAMCALGLCMHKMTQKEDVAGAFKDPSETDSAPPTRTDGSRLSEASDFSNAPSNKE